MEKMLSQEVKAGDLFYTSWGYDQTNYDYVMVLGLSASGKTAICQMAKAKVVGYSHQCYEQEPQKETYGAIFRMRIKEGYRGDVCLRGSYPFCASGSMESTRLDTFYRVEEGRTYFETDSMFGH